MSKHITKKGLDLIKHFEGLYLKAYQCSAGVWTIGYGHTGLTHKDGTVYEGRIVTEEEATELLARDMEYFEKVVLRLVSEPVNDDEFDALVSFAFNCGEGNLESSTLLRKLNAGDHVGASREFIRWNRSDGEVSNGLTRRRASEERLFQGVVDYYVFSVEELKKLGYPVV